MPQITLRPSLLGPVYVCVVGGNTYSCSDADVLARWMKEIGVEVDGTSMSILRYAEIVKMRQDELSDVASQEIFSAMEIARAVGDFAQAERLEEEWERYNTPTAP